MAHPLATPHLLPVRIGCAGWAISREESKRFPPSGTHLQRYSQVFSAVEINSSFYRSHRPATYARWGASVTESFRFSVKCPRQITHQLRLKSSESLLGQFFREISELQDRLGCVLIQLPPSLVFSRKTATEFFESVRELSTVPIAVESRHRSWFTPEVEDLLRQFQMARVVADPAYDATAKLPGGYEQFVYLRMHGSPRIYYSTYDDAALAVMSELLSIRHSQGAECWCIFDNTALGAAIPNALELQQLLSTTSVG